MACSVAAIWMGACGSASPRSPSSSSVTPPTPGSTASNQSIAADNAAAKAAALKQSDFPTDLYWTSESQSNGTVNGSIDGRLASCLGVREEQLTKPPAGFDSPNFTGLSNLSDHSPTLGNRTVSSHVGYRSSIAAQGASFDLFAGSKTAECLGKAVAAMVEYALKHPPNPASTTSWTPPGPTSSLVGQPTVSHMYVPTFGGRSIGHRVNVVVAAPPIGYPGTLYFDQIIVITGRADVIMTFQEIGNPFPTDQEVLYTELVVGRLTNTGAKPATKTTTTPPPIKINWVRVRPPGPAPTVGVAMTYDPDTRRVVLSDGSNLWTWNGSIWAKDGSAENGAAMAYDPDSHQLVVFGGETGFPPTYLSDTWTRNGSTWTHARPATSPAARAHTTMAYDPDTHRLTLFGGESAGSLSDTWTWDGSTWTQLRPAASPSDRDGTAMAYDPNTHQLLLNGGGVSTDTWTWNGSTWTEATPATSPPGRQYAAMAYDPDIHRMVLFGGAGAANPLSDTWTWDGSTWTQVIPATQPPAIERPAMAYDPETHHLVLFDNGLWVLRAG